MFFWLFNSYSSVLFAQPNPGIPYSQAMSIYQQNFDGLPVSGSFSLSGKGPHQLSAAPILAGNLAGWQFIQSGGSGANAVFLTGTGSGTGQGVYSVGSSGSTDRALGSMASGTGISSVGLIFTNTTGFTLNKISVALTAEQWRKGGSTNRNTWTCKYKTGILQDINVSGCSELAALNFYSPINTSGSGSLNGNLPEQQIQVNQSLEINEWKPGEQLVLRWEDADESGSDDLVAIDQFSFQAEYIPPPPVKINTILSLANNPTNADTIRYAILLGGNISGLSPANFSLKTNGLSKASILKVEGSLNEYNATIYTGEGMGMLQLGITNDSNLVPGIQDLPFFSIDSQMIDKVKPYPIRSKCLSKPILTQGDTLVLAVKMNEPVLKQETDSAFYIQAMLGNKLIHLNLVSGNGADSLVFIYPIQAGESDKNGIEMNQTNSAAQLTVMDLAGNTGKIILPDNLLSSVVVDAIAPTFLKATDSLFLCTQFTRSDLSNLLSVTNVESGETITWFAIQPPSHISIPSGSLTKLSDGSAGMMPDTVYWEKNNNYIGPDSCMFYVTDGVQKNFKKIYFYLAAEDTANRIEGNQEICTGTAPQLLKGSPKTDSLSRYVWQYSLMSDSTGFNTVLGNYQMQDYQPDSLPTTTWFRRIIQQGPCNNISNPVMVKIWNAGYWKGEVDTNWHNVANWCNGKIPDDTSDVLIPALSRYSPVISGIGKCRSIKLLKNAHISIYGSLSVREFIYADSGAIYAEEGSIIQSGNIPQILTGTMFQQNKIGKLIIENGTGVTIDQKIILTKLLGISKGILHTNGFLHVKYGAIVGPCANGTGIHGEVMAYHPFSDSSISNRLIGHPFNQSISINQLNQPQQCFYIDPLFLTDSFSIANDWKNFSRIDSAANSFWKRHQGILLKSSGQTISFQHQYLKGSLNTGLQEIQLFKNNTAGFNIISNPFISPINMAACIPQKKLGRHYWIWNPTQGYHGGYTAIPFSQNFTINPFESMIVETNALTDNALLIPEESKTGQWNETGLMPYKEDNGFYVEIGIYKNGLFFDRWILTEQFTSKNSFDSLDAIKLSNTDLNFYSLSSDAKKLCVDARKIDSTSVIPLHIETNLKDRFLLRINQAFLPENNKLVLHDRYTRQFCPLKKDSTYSFDFTEDSLSRKSDRFEISRLLPYGDIQQLINFLTIKLFPNPVNKELMAGFKANSAGNTVIHIYSLNGQIIKSFNLGFVATGLVKIPVSELNNGSYLLQIICGEQKRSIPFIKQ